MAAVGKQQAPLLAHKKNDSGADALKPSYCTDTKSQLTDIATRLHSFCSRFLSSALKMFNHENRKLHAKRYLEGLLSNAGRKNMGQMDQHVKATENSDYEAMQHFISTSSWDESTVYDFISAQAQDRLGGRPETVLIIDESAFSKKGDKSCGVGRQHNGRLGKQDNCQVGVFSVLNCKTQSALVGARLFLPEDWIKNEERCLKAGVPEEHIKQHTKIVLAQELIAEAVARQLKFACVAVDAFYGRDSSLLGWMDAQGLIYCADIPANAQIFESKPTSAARPKPISKSTIRADAYAAELTKQKGQHIILREGENGSVSGEFWARRIWVWPAQEEAPRECWLLVRKCQDGTLKLSLCNAPATTPIERMAHWQASRFFIERTFEDAKTNAGMADYEARGWKAWHHHMAMVALATLFIMEERIFQCKETPLLSARDIVELLDWHLAKPRSETQAVAAVLERHQKRYRQALAAQNRARERDGRPKIKKPRFEVLPK